MADLRWPTYALAGLTLEAAEPDPRGSMRVRDGDGRVYLDAVGGIGCAPLGHAHPRWVSAVHTQLERLATAGNMYLTRPQQELARRLAALAPISDGRVFLCNTGTEAIEAALKLVLRASGRDRVLACEGAFHGRTLGSIALTANPAYRQPYVTCPDDGDETRFGSANVSRFAFNDLAAARAAFDRAPNRVAAVFVEPIQGEAGVVPASAAFLLGLRALCDEHGALLVVDEIQSGAFRTGAFAAWTALVDETAQPDVMTVAKALGGGFPIGACIARAELAGAMEPGSHGTTFGGNPVACAAACATLDVIEDEGLAVSAASQLPILMAVAQRQPLAVVREIRGLGAMIGIQVGARESKAAAPLAAELQRRGILVTVCGGHTVRLLLPYRAQKSELLTIWEALADATAVGAMPA